MRIPNVDITLVLIALTCAVSWLAWQSAAVMQRLILWPPAIARRGEVHRLLTYGFVHADGMHLLFNMVTLFFFGRVMEQVMTQLSGSRLTFVAFYFSALVVSILPTYLKHQKDPNYRSLGASGAVSCRCRPSSSPCSTSPTASGWTGVAATTSITAPTSRAPRTASCSSRRWSLACWATSWNR
jgi:hypothetical protein